IAFVSSRARRWVSCFVTPVGLIYRCDAAGGNIRLLTSNVDHDLRPRMMADGRLLFTRWEYVDRNEEGEWELWAMRPDGSGLAKLFSNQLMSARPIPGSNRLIAVSCLKNAGFRSGPLVTVDPGFEPDAGATLRFEGAWGHGAVITPIDGGAGQTPPRAPQGLLWSGSNRDPLAVSDRWAFFASSQGLELLRLPDAGAQAQHELLVAHPRPRAPPQATPGALFYHEPEALAPHPREPLVAPVTDWAKTTGRLLLADVNRKRPEANPPEGSGNSQGLHPGEIKAIAVYEILPTPFKSSDNTSGQLSLGSTWNLKRYLGTFPVEPDGSAAVEIPGRRFLQLVGLDQHGDGIKRMHAGLSVMPGETRGCVGCHEYRTQTPQATRTLQALNRPVSLLKVESGLPADGLVGYVRTIQPIWDRHCVRCHNSGQWAGGLNLSANRGTLYSHSAFLLVWRGLVSLPALRGQDLPYPQTLGAPASPLLKLLRTAHHGVKISDAEIRRVQIWIDSGGIYASHNACNDTGYGPDLKLPLGPCVSCHKHSQEFQAKHGSDGPHGDRRERFPGWSSLLVDLTQPEYSLALRAPLAKAAGGLGWCQQSDGQPVFASKDDPNYKIMAARIPKPDASGRVPVNSFEWPGFQPAARYLEMMQKFGALRPDFDPEREQLDLQALDENYYRLFYPGADDSGMSHYEVGACGEG
ncbi:MAG: hypothetical protein NTV49_06360, partial [Kiritimatiellaeota bacterium]|nr:hypothetical protein [Kiritimatiellota bacterium]